MTIAAGIVFFDDEKGLQRCLSSVQSYVDLIIAIDGKFKHFEEEHDLSIDNSRKVVESFPNAIYRCYPNLTEIDKRNKYLIDESLFSCLCSSGLASSFLNMTGTTKGPLHSVYFESD